MYLLFVSEIEYSYDWSSAPLSPRGSDRTDCGLRATAGDDLSASPWEAGPGGSMMVDVVFPKTMGYGKPYIVKFVHVMVHTFR